MSVFIITIIYIIAIFGFSSWGLGLLDFKKEVAKNDRIFLAIFCFIQCVMIVFSLFKLWNL